MKQVERGKLIQKEPESVGCWRSPSGNACMNFSVMCLAEVCCIAANKEEVITVMPVHMQLSRSFPDLELVGADLGMKR